MGIVQDEKAAAAVKSAQLGRDKGATDRGGEALRQRPGTLFRNSYAPVLRKAIHYHAQSAKSLTTV